MEWGDFLKPFPESEYCTLQSGPYEQGAMGNKQ